MAFCLYVSGFWHIYAKTPRGIMAAIVTTLQIYFLLGVIRKLSTAFESSSMHPAIQFPFFQIWNHRIPLLRKRCRKYQAIIMFLHNILPTVSLQPDRHIPVCSVIQIQSHQYPDSIPDRVSVCGSHPSRITRSNSSRCFSKHFGAGRSHVAQLFIYGRNSFTFRRHSG